jgi:hypothetical protein
MRGLVMALLARDVPGNGGVSHHRAGRFVVPFLSTATKTITKKTTAKTV